VNKTTARLVLTLGFVVYMIMAVVPVTLAIDLLRLWGLPPGADPADAFWSGHLDDGREIILTALNVIFIWFWATYVKKLVYRRLMKGPRERALEALKGSRS
jgi:hypothetical protein